jgi:hypothetical protein
VEKKGYLMSPSTFLKFLILKVNISMKVYKYHVSKHEWEDLSRKLKSPLINLIPLGLLLTK